MNVNQQNGKGINLKEVQPRFNEDDFYTFSKDPAHLSVTAIIFGIILLTVILVLVFYNANTISYVMGGISVIPFLGFCWISYLAVGRTYR